MGSLVMSRAGATPFWTYAAVYGALWGALEVTLGSLLHALRVPFLGALLAMTQAAYLVGVHTLVPRRGLVLAVSFVAALVKGLSPAGAVLPPMVAICAQGALVEVCLRLPGQHLPAALAGGLAPMWAVLQALLTQILYFGGAALSLYGRLLHAVGRGTGLPKDRVWVTVAVPLGLLFLGGALFGLWGRRLGQRARARLGAKEPCP